MAVIACGQASRVADHAHVTKELRIVSESPEGTGIVWAKAAGGQRLPVIDVTQPAFALADDAASNAALFRAYRDAERRQARTPRFLTRMMIALAARQSPLVHAIVHPRAGFLDGLTTYIMKLGADNLPPPFRGKIDRRMAAAAPVVSMRMRLQQCAALLAEGLRNPLANAPSARLLLVNIAGGTAIDTLNALILLKRDAPDLLARPIQILVLDIDSAGPTFGANAVAALTQDGRALAGLNLSFRHEFYDWNRTETLDDVVRQSAAQGAILAASSEGGLFEYGSDNAVVANLSALSHGAALLVGSVTRADAMRRDMIASGKFKLVPRGVEGFTPLAERGGFVLERVKSTPISDQVLLRPARLA
jgi:hypothetical protein